MQSIRLKSHVGRDGLLTVHLPDIKEQDIDIVIVYQTSRSSSNDFPSSFYGCIQDDSFVRPSQPLQPERESFS